MIADYRRDAVLVFYGFRQLSLTKLEKNAKDKSDGIEMVTAYQMISELPDNVSHIWVN